MDQNSRKHTHDRYLWIQMTTGSVSQMGGGTLAIPSGRYRERAHNVGYVGDDAPV